MKFLYLLGMPIFLFYACTDHKDTQRKKDADSIVSSEKEIKNIPDSIKQYKIPSAIISYVGVSSRNNESTSALWTFYFNDYGMNKRMDRFEKKELIESHCSVGNSKFYIINHRNKTFDGLEEASKIFNVIVSKDSVLSNKDYVKSSDEIVAGKDCEIFIFQTKDYKYKYGFWKDVCLLYEFEMKGNPIFKFKSSPLKVEERELSTALFSIPSGYKRGNK
jgi:hypothetical protein